MVWYWVCGSEISEIWDGGKWKDTPDAWIFYVVAISLSRSLIVSNLYIYIQNKKTLAAINLASLGMVHIPSIELVILGWSQWSSEDKQLHAVTNIQQSCNFVI